MSTFEEEFSDSSFDGSGSASMRDEPPTLDETIFDSSLFNLFLGYMKSQQAMGNLMFLKNARKFRLLNQPRDILIYQAATISMMHFSAAAPLPVTLSDELKKKMAAYAFDASALLSLDKDSFSLAFGEVYNAVIPHFRNWISTGEWRDAIPYHRIPPPTFSVVLTSSTLRVLFNKFLKSQLDQDSEGSAGHAYQMWKFCLIVNDFREGKYSYEPHSESKKKKKGDSESTGSEKPKEEQKKINPEEYAKRVYKKFKHHVSLPYDGTLTYAIFIVRALDHIIEEFDKSALYAHWIGLKQYLGVDYQAKVVHQTLTAEGFAEPPTLAAALSSSLLPAFLAMLQGTEQGLNIEFLVNILKFHQKYRHLDPESSLSVSGSVGTATSEKTHKDMVEEATLIFKKFLDKSEMYCDPGLVEEVRNLIHKNGGKGCNPSMFRKTGTFIYQRSEHTWCREARATFDWVTKSYDNHSRNSRLIEEEFSTKNLPENFDLQIVPSIDDVYGNPSLVKDYGDFVDANTDMLFSKFQDAFKEYFATHIHSRKPVLQKLMNIFADASKIYPELAVAHSTIEKEIATRETVSDLVPHVLFAALVRSMAASLYKRWLVEHSMAWKKASWSPVSAVRYGDLSLIMGMSAVETKIEEEALKGKTGLSRYFAKRQVKKQSISSVRAGAVQVIQDNKSALDTGYGEEKGEEARSEPTSFDVSLAARVPTINETLGSPYLRTFFQRGIIEKVLNEEQMELYKAFFVFYRKYDVMDNDQACNSQEEMLHDALELCDKYKDVLPHSAETKERAKKQKFLFPTFFRPEEIELYGKYHTIFEGGLRKKGWQ